MKKVIFIFATFASIVAQTAWKHEDFEKYNASQKTIAILPFIVTEQDVSPDSKDKTARLDSVKCFEMQKICADKIPASFDKGKYELSIQLQDISETNRLLEEAGITLKKLSLTTKKELAAILGVDAVVTSEISMTKNSSGGDAAAAWILGGTTTNGSMTWYCKINDGASGDMIFKISKAITTWIFVSQDKMSEWMAGSLIGTWPYTKKRKK